ncbi:MAG: sodium:alanine symporter family protein [Chlorobi bacterium]|nr:sodium:alanine symporter family protein [Chlorobiota bacterium]
MSGFEQLLNTISGYVWGVPLLAVLFGTHLFLTFRLGFIQKHTFSAIRMSLTRTREGEGEITHFGALVTALAATIGTGNIVGVATAIAAGGPGAVLWMWLTGVFGMATKYSEALLSVKYRVVGGDGSVSGGPMYVLEKAMNMKWLAVLFAAFTVVASFGIGNMVQANSIAAMVETNFSIAPWITGAVLTAFTAVVIIGGIKSIAKVCEYLVPFMALIYVAGCIVLLVLRSDTLPDTLQLIISSAFNGQAALGGFAGAGVKEAMRFGIARGLFSNESGLGSAPIVAAAAQTSHPVRQALISATGTFWDTVVLCAVTGIVVVNSGMWQTGLKGAELTDAAFNEVPHIGNVVLTFGLLTFVFSTILGWSYYGEKAMEYLFGKQLVVPYRWAWVVAVMVGSVVSLQVVWAFADIANALMAMPNLVSLLVLSPVVAAETKAYFLSQMNSSIFKEPFFDNSELPEVFLRKKKG